MTAFGLPYHKRPNGRTLLMNRRHVCLCAGGLRTCPSFRIVRNYCTNHKRFLQYAARHEGHILVILCGYEDENFPFKTFDEPLTFARRFADHFIRSRSLPSLVASASGMSSS